ncbi:MAG: hypothetical protein MI922_11315, partial [Bacteroidales bacterium]|nr:hypothetical protein [Bacteroidales bacterium]
AGQGLLYWTGYSNGKSLYFNSAQKRSMDFKGNTSFNETQFLRGVGVGLQLGKFQLNLFGSQNQRDGSYLDSTKNSITSFSLSGYHRTDSELNKRRNITENVYGGSANITSNHAKFGVNMLYTQYSKPLTIEEDLYQIHNPQGSEYLGVSVDYRILYSRFQLYGETSYSNDAIATLNSLALNLYQNNSLLLLHRHYDKSYFSPLSNAFGVNTTNRNEQGVFIGSDIKLGSKLNFLGYFDVFYFPWLKFGIKSASRGRDARAKLSYEVSDHFHVFLQYSYAEKEKTISTSEEAVSASVIAIKLNKYRLNLQYDLTSYLHIRNQVEYSVYNEESDYEDGWLINSTIKFRPERIPGFRSVVGLTNFYIPSYDARIYSYEYDVPGSFSFIGFSGKGSRFSILLQYKITQKLDVYVKYAQAVFTDTDAIGSSYSYIEGNTKSEFKLQLLYKF